MRHPNKNVMQQAIVLAREKYSEGGYAVAAIIVKGNRKIAKAFTTIARDQDPTAHAEINAIRAAARYYNTRLLKNCYLYTTFEPCPMCASAAVWAKMKGIIYGASMNDATQTHPQRIKIRCREILKKGNPTIKLYENFQRDDCKELLKL